MPGGCTAMQIPVTDMRQAIRAHVSDNLEGYSEVHHLVVTGRARNWNRSTCIMRGIIQGRHKEHAHNHNRFSLHECNLCHPEVELQLQVEDSKE